MDIVMASDMAVASETAKLGLVPGIGMLLCSSYTLGALENTMYHRAPHAGSNIN